jgi:hypothetical protein
MGADMLIACLSIPSGRRPDFAACHRAVERLAPTDIEDPDEFHEFDLGTESGMRGLRHDLHRSVEKLEEALEGRQFALLGMGGTDVYLTGGLSWGDSPTQAFELVDHLRCVRGILVAAGFEGEAW